MTKITLIRHGQTNLNLYDIIQGSTNAPLNETGLRQASELGEKLKDISYDICYVSPLIRTKETALKALSGKCSFVLDDRIVERNFGDVEGYSNELLDNKVIWDRDLNTSMHNIETINNVFERCKLFLDDIINKNKDKSIAVVCHYTPFKVMHYLLTDDSYDNHLNYDIKNCQTEEIIINN